MSEIKLIINKFEAGTCFKSLNVTIQDEESYSSETTYSEWLDGKSQQKKKENEKASRLVVKIVSGDEVDRLNLDLCAKEVDEESYTCNTAKRTFLDLMLQSYPSLPESSTSRAIFSSEESRHNTDFIQNGMGSEEIMPKLNDGTSVPFNINHDNRDILYEHDIDKYCSNSAISPLEHSLEKVKENNARIMENIQILNRTWNYTKNKEILDIVCPKSMRSYPCNTCGKCFVYETGLRRHYSMRHAISEMQPRWQVVWTCIQCFQVWPRQDQAIKHAKMCCESESADCVREIKTSSLLQCEFCEKVFTSIPRLLRHSKIHTTTNNYECNACQMAFLSYKMAEQHWLLCPWLKMYYCFALPKLLLCNACDRKFRNYEQLYTHRYKVSHFMTKTHCQGNTKSLGILVYQCEICGQWYPSIPPLKIHRSQFHARNESGMLFRMDNNWDNTPSNYFIPAENEYQESPINVMNDDH